MKFTEKIKLIEDLMGFTSSYGFIDYDVIPEWDESDGNVDTFTLSVTIKCGNYPYTMELTLHIRDGVVFYEHCKGEQEDIFTGETDLFREMSFAMLEDLKHQTHRVNSC